MSVSAGSKAPAFSLESDDGSVLTLAGFAGKTLVLYFYPKDDTSGCTAEAIDFTARLGAFAKAGAIVVGVSKESAASKAKFRKKHALGVKLGADTGGEVVEAYEVWVEKSMYGRKYMGIERATFLIDGTGVIRQVWNKVKVPGHAAEVLKAAQALA